MALLEIRDLQAGYGEVQILWGVELSLERGRLTALVGGNGVGKTTLLRTVMGTLRPKTGSILFRGQEVVGLPAYRRAELGLVLVPEGRQLFTSMTVEENMELGATNRRSRPKFVRNLERVYSLFPRLRERRHQKTGTLSGGEQQMAAVARGLMADPEILMFDELSLGLSPMLVLHLFETLQQLKSEGLTMLLVEQNVHMALRVGDYGYVLADGRVSLQGSAKELARNPEVQKAYLGI